MRRAGVVALNTFREAVRDRVLYNLVFFALLMMAAAILVGQISIGIESIVVVSLGLSAISVIGLLIAIFIGVGLVYKEMDKRTLYALLAKPVRRWEFLLGKFGGLVLTLTVNTAAMAAGLFLVLHHAAAFHIVHRWIVYLGIVRAGDAHVPQPDAQTRSGSHHAPAFLPPSEFPEFRRDGLGSAWPRDSWRSHPGEHDLHGGVLRDCVVNGGGCLFATRP